MPEARDDETLREALLELERARSREQQARAEASTLLEAMEAMTQAASPYDAVAALLDHVARAFRAQAAAILRPESENAVIAAHATDAGLVGALWREPARRIAKPRRVIEIDHAALGAPDALADYRSLMSTPIRLPDGETAALACFSRERAGFSGAELQFLGRLGGLAAQALAAHGLWERHALLGGVIEGSANALAIFDAVSADYPCIYVNPAFERLTGHPAAEVIGAPWDQLCDGWRLDEDRTARAAMRETIAARRSGVFEVRNRRRDRTAYWARVNLFPVSGADGVVRQFVATQADITARREAQIERDAARAQLDSALSSTDQGFVVLGPGGEVAYANAAFAHFFPAPETWRLGEDFAVLWCWSRRAQGRDPAAAKADGRAIRDWAFSGGAAREETLPDGRTALLSARRTSDHGSVVTAVDITEMKRAEALLAERAAAIDAAQDGIALTDAEGRFRYMNPSHLAMFGFSAQDEVVGRPWDMLYEPESAERIRREAFPALGRCGAWRGESLGRKRDGAPVEQEVSLTRLPDGGLVCVTRDIAERRHGERERARLREEVQTAQRREAVGQIAAGVAHDFNNVLSAISGSAALAGAALPDAARAQPHLDRITRAAESGAELMRRLHGLGAREKRRVRLDLAAPLRNVAELVRAGAGLDVSVVTDLPETPIVAEADPTDILHLALNLGVNARDALGAAGGRITLGLRRVDAPDPGRTPLIGSVDPTRAYAVITVADTGEGVSDDMAETMFKPHVSTKGDAGTGLGLAIVAGVVAENGAALSLISAPGDGACFEVFWPIDKPSGPPPDKPAPTPETGAAGTALSGRMILLAEDCSGTLETLAAFLEGAGAEVAPCDDPQAAAEALEDDPDAWDLLITDLEMPGMDGATLAARARAAAPGIPVILCTGAAEGPVSGVSDRFDAVLRKPVSASDLLAAVRGALAGIASGGD